MMMRLLILEVSVQLAVFVAIGSSSGTVYITDLPIYSVLAPCAAEAVSYAVQGLTEEKCPQSVTALESCACTQDQNSVSIASNIASNVQEGCGKTASEDLASASSVFSAYCNQAAAVTLPTGGPVTEFITDLPAFSELGRCAADAVSYAVQGLTDNKCPGAASLLASCACTKDQNSLAVSEAINSNVIENCGSTHTEDFTSAQAVFAGYCGMGAGTTSFPSPSYLSGDVTYYITDLPTYSSLATCAQWAVSYPVFELANNDCPAAPLAMVSCACVKDQNSQAMSSQIASQIGENCGTTATDDVSSALGVFAYYCSAGKGLVTPKGVTASVTTTAYGTGSGYTYTSGPTATNTNTGSLIQLPGTSSSSKVPLAAIIGGSIGALIVVIFILFVGWRYRLHHKPRPPPPAELHSQNPNTNDFEKAELPGASAATMLSKPVARKPTPSVAVSPVSPRGSESAVLAGRTEMESQNRNEVPVGPNVQELHPENARYEVQGQPYAQELVSVPRYEVLGSNHPVEVPGAPRANMNEGPFYELEGPYR